VNRRVYITVEDDEYNGRTRSRVSGYETYKPEAGAEAEGSLDDLDEFTAPSTSESITDLPEPEEAVAAAPEPEKVAPPATSEIGAGRTGSEIGEVPGEKAPAPAAADDEDSIDLDDFDLDAP